jgi:hypothetical protein
MTADGLIRSGRRDGDGLGGDVQAVIAYQPRYPRWGPSRELCSHRRESSQANARADTERGGGRRDSSDRRDRSRGAGVVEQVREAPPELGLIQSGAFLPRSRPLARASPLGRIAAPPCCRLD